MNKIINVDVDDTLMDFIGYAQKVWLPENWGYSNLPDPDTYNLSKAGWFTSEEEMFNFLTEFALKGSYKNLELIDPNTPRIIKNLQNNGYRIRIVTVRGTQGDEKRKNIEREDTITSILKHGIDPDEWVFSKNKAKYPALLAVDDSPSHYEKYVNAGFNVALMNASHNKFMVNNDRVFNWSDVEKRVMNLQTKILV